MEQGKLKRRRRMPKTIGVIPAYGNDYKSKAEVWLGLENQHDFRIADISNPYDGKYCSLRELKKAGYDTIQVRFNKLRNLAFFKTKDFA
jgi:hypothetical protein